MDNTKMTRTRDGIRLDKVLKVAKEIVPKLLVRAGTKHPYMLTIAGFRPCPVAASTDVRKMVAPWLRDATGYSPREIYQAFQRGHWDG